MKEEFKPEYKHPDVWHAGCQCLNPKYSEGELHECPYSCEIYEDCEPKCKCCPVCTYECAMDI